MAISFILFANKIVILQKRTPFISVFFWKPKDFSDKSHSSLLSHVYNMYLLYIAVGHVLIDHRIMEGSCHPSVCIHCTVLQFSHRPSPKTLFLHIIWPWEHFTVAVWPEIMTLFLLQGAENNRSCTFHNWLKKNNWP